MTEQRDRGRDVPPPRPAYGQIGDDAGAEHGRWEPPAEVPPATSPLRESLEPGALRDELAGGAPDTPKPPAGPPPVHVARLQFTGDGAEYFRIWIVNTLLTVATLGIYSAWAKVRKTRYFWQNTRLDGHAFDFHGRPLAILIGRILALVLFLAYSFAFEFSRTAGLTMIAVLFVVGPWMLMRAQRFKFGNTSWRGLRFGFASNAAEAYRVALPPLLIWFSGAIALALNREGFMAAALLGAASAALLPWMHHRLKAYQHARAYYGARAFDFLPATRRFYAVYFIAGLLSIGAVLVIVVPGSFGVGALVASLGRERAEDWAAVGMLVGVAGVFAAFLCAWPYFAARLQATVWSHTRLGDVRFGTAIAAWPLTKLVAKNVLLTLITAGLYWPFAAVALARYRVHCMRAESQQPLVALAAATPVGASGAAGDAALDAFGLDIGL